MPRKRNNVPSRLISFSNSRISEGSMRLARVEKHPASVNGEGSVNGIRCIRENKPAMRDQSSPKRRGHRKWHTCGAARQRCPVLLLSQAGAPRRRE